MKKEHFGINMTQYVRHHEESVQKGETTIWQHEQMIRWIQHERLIHLIVMALTIISMFFCLILSLIAHGSLAVVFSLLALVLLVLSMFYIKHYFFLENHVQKWYLVMEEMQNGGASHD